MFASLNLHVGGGGGGGPVSCITTAVQSQAKTADLLYAKLSAAKRDLSVAEKHAQVAAAAAAASVAASAEKIASVHAELDATKQRLRVVNEALEEHERPDRAALERVHALEARAHASKTALADLHASTCAADREALVDRADYDRAVARRARHCALTGAPETATAVSHIHLGATSATPVRYTAADAELNAKLLSLAVGYPRAGRAADDTGASSVATGDNLERYIAAVSLDIQVSMQTAVDQYAKASAAIGATPV